MLVCTSVFCSNEYVLYKLRVSTMHYMSLKHWCINLALILFSVPAPDPSPQLETFKKKDVIEILSYKKAYNACKYKNPSVPLNILPSVILLSVVLCAKHYVTRPFSHSDCAPEAVSWGAASGADEHGH